MIGINLRALKQMRESSMSLLTNKEAGKRLDAVHEEM